LSGIEHLCSHQVSHEETIDLNQARAALNGLSETTRTAKNEPVILVKQGQKFLSCISYSYLEVYFQVGAFKYSRHETNHSTLHKLRSTIKTESFMIGRASIIAV
jgi:hypothetical protein